MANLKEVRNRIGSVRSTMQITSAMKMVSAAKLKRAQDAITQMRPYANRLQSILSNVASTLESNESKFGSAGSSNNTLLISITSNRGLCGGFNNNVLKATRTYIDTHTDENVEVLGLGKKSFDFYAKTPFHSGILDQDGSAQIFDGLSYEKSTPISGEVMELFSSNKYSKVILIYNHFKNAAIQDVMVEDFLPMKPVETEDAVEVQSEYLFNPSKEEIVKDLIPKSLHLQLFKALLDSHASEHGARMTAMHKATDNAGELLKDLQLTYNKARQAAITTEILEIVSGAEALNA